MQGRAAKCVQDGGTATSIHAFVGTSQQFAELVRMRKIRQFVPYLVESRQIGPLRQRSSRRYAFVDCTVAIGFKFAVICVFVSKFSFFSDT